jgi:UDP-N-acetylglucosamine acyltransferase
MATGRRLGHDAPVSIHPTAVVDPRARLHPSVAVGPYAVIDGDVVLGEGCRVGAHVYLTGRLTAGARNIFDTGAVLGGAPQDLKFAGGLTGLRLGDDNVFREHVTVHRSNRPEEDTVIGSGNLLMAHCHVGHNSQLGDRVIIANGALLGGHVLVQDRAFISGNCLIHQFVRVGTLALMQGGSAISKDLAPYCVARGDNGICGLNTIGLRRAGLDAEVRRELRRLYRELFRSGRGFREALLVLETLVRSEWGARLLEFARTTRRGLVTSSRSLRVAGDAEADEKEAG